MLEPDRNQIKTFVGALFRHAQKNGVVSLRTFYHDNKVARITPTALTRGLPFLIEAAEDDARRAANLFKPAVFAPPIATFLGKGAREVDLLDGLALSVECDAHPKAARRKLEALLGL